MLSTRDQRADASEPVAPVDAPVPADGLPRRFGANVVANYVAEAATALVALLSTPILLRALGDEAFGIWVLAGSVILYLELFELGFGAATVKLVAEDAGRRPLAVLRTLNTSFFVLAAFGAVALVVGLVVAAFAPAWFAVPPALARDTTWVFAILALSLAVSVPADTFGGALGGYQRYDLLSTSNLLLALLSGLAMIAVALLGGGLVPLAAVVAALSLSMHGVRFGFLRRLLPELRLSTRLVDRGRIRLTAGISGWFLLRDIANVLINRVDLLVVGLALGVREVAVFAIGLKLAQLSRKALIPLSQVFFPHASALSRERNHAQLGALLVDGTRTAMLAGIPIMLVLTVLGDVIVTAWVGSGYAAAAAVLLFLAAGRGLMSVTDTAWWLLAGAGRIRGAALVAVAEALTNLVLSVLLVGPLGAPGVALGTFLGVLLVSVPSALVLGSRAAGVPLPALCRRAILPHALPVSAAVTVLVAARQLLPAAPVPAAAAALASVAAYLAVYLATAATPTERSRVTAAVRTVNRLAPRAAR